MRQFVVPEDWDGGPECRLAGGKARYLSRVLRLKPGDSFPGLDRSGRSLILRVLSVTEDGLRLAVLDAGGPGEASGDSGSVGSHPSRLSDLPLPDLRSGSARGAPTFAGKVLAETALAGKVLAVPAHDETGLPASPKKARGFPAITLIPSVLKGDKMDLVIRQAVEAGVARIIPLLSVRCVPRLEDADKRHDRWRRIVAEALQQSGSSTATILEPAAGIQELPARLGEGKEGCVRIVCHEQPLESGSLHAYCSRVPQDLAVALGPEGGFAAEEISALRALGFLPLRFPGAVLRAETAALYAVAAVEVICSERETWSLV